MKKFLIVLVVATSAFAYCYYVSCFPSVLSGKLSVETSIDKEYFQLSQKAQEIVQLKEKEKQLLQRQIELLTLLKNKSVLEKNKNLLILKDRLEKKFNP